MKTLKIIPVLLVVLLVASCNTAYKVTTTINSNGSVKKEVYAWADSAFMAGDLSHNPFLFNLDSEWEISRLDSATSYTFFNSTKKFNVKISKNLSSVNDFAQQTQTSELKRQIAVPQESLTKHFRWFYTYYKYTGKYAEITDKGTIPISDYLTENEQKLLLQGDMSTYQGLNGIELNDALNDINDKFGKWISRSCYEISFGIIKDALGENLYSSQLSGIKDTLFKIGMKEDAEQEFSPKNVCRLLDKYFNTTYFSALQNENQKAFDGLHEQKTQTINLFEYTISYELIMPGEVMQAGTTLKNGDNALVWKIDAYRFLADDYVITAESRTVNYWAFAVTGILALVAIFCLIKITRQKRM